MDSVGSVVPRQFFALHRKNRSDNLPIHFGSSAAEYWCIVLAHDIMQGCIPSVIQHDEHSIYVI